MLSLLPILSILFVDYFYSSRYCSENHAVESLERMADWVASLPHRMLTGPHGRVNKGPSVMPSYMKKHMYRKSKIDRGVALKKVNY